MISEYALKYSFWTYVGFKHCSRKYKKKHWTLLIDLCPYVRFDLCPNVGNWLTPNQEFLPFLEHLLGNIASRLDALPNLT
jgi:hypothetical protein